MARGWESKSVEDQVAQQAEEHHPTETSGRPPTAQELAAIGARQRQRQELELQRERILDERTSNPIRRAALEAALSEIEARLSSL